MDRKRKKLVLSDGSEYLGYSFGGDGESVCKMVFDTSMAQYQEIMTDPAYSNLTVVMTYPVIGSYGIADEDYESRTPMIGGLVVRDYNDLPSNYRSTKTLGEVLEDNNIPAICGVDTRKIAKLVRDNGEMVGYIANEDKPLEECLKIIKNTRFGDNQVQRVSCKKRWYSRTTRPQNNVVIIDCGVKNSTVKGLNKCGCNVTVVPYDTTAKEIERLQPNGVVISNGPGSPNVILDTVGVVKEIIGKYPIMGVGLGCLVLAKAMGAEIYMQQRGHFGSNYPVKCVRSGKIQVSVQGHNYGIIEASLAKTEIEITHRNVTDNTVEGIEKKDGKAFGILFQAECQLSAQGEGDAFDKFTKLMEENKNA